MDNRYYAQNYSQNMEPTYYGGSLCRHVRYPCGMSVKSNFTCDPIFLIHQDLEKNWFPFFSLS